MGEITATLVAIVSAPLSALLTAVFLRTKHNAEVDKLRAEVKQTLADVRGRELDNDKKAIEMIMELVVEPLRKDMLVLQEKVDTLTNAIEKINSCPHADNCPVSHELRHPKKGSAHRGEPHGGDRGGTGDRAQQERTAAHGMGRE